MTPAAEALVAMAYGVASALVPVVNAEAYAVLAGARSLPATAAFAVLALALGQTVGKLMLFEAARRGSSRWSGPLAACFARHGRGRAVRWAGQLREGMACRRTGLPLVLVSASVGLPPLAAVSLAAGASGQRRWEFGVVCLLGRAARFGFLMTPLAWALG